MKMCLFYKDNFRLTHLEDNKKTNNWRLSDTQNMSGQGSSMMVHETADELTSSPLSKQTLVSRFNDTNTYYEKTLQNRISQMQQLNNIKLNITISGDTTRKVGDVLDLELPSVEPVIDGTVPMDKLYNGTGIKYIYLGTTLFPTNIYEYEISIRTDTTGLYTGTQQINQAQLDRWEILTTLNYLSLEKEMKIILSKNKKLNNPKGKEKVSNMIKVASLTRKGFMAGDISTVMSPRTVLNWCGNSEIFKDIGYAFRITFLNKCDDSEKSTIAEYYQRCFGEDLPESMINIQI